MKGSPGARLAIGLSSLSIAMFLALLCFSLLRMSSIQQSLRLQAPHNMLWVAHQAQRASLRLEHGITLYRYGASQPGDLETHYNIWLSRVRLLMEGQQYRSLHDLGYTTEWEQLQQQMPVAEAHVQALLAGDLSVAADLEAFIAESSRLFGRLATDAMMAEWDSAGSWMDSIRYRLWQIFGSLLGIFASGLVLVINLLLARRTVRRQTSQIDREREFSRKVIDSSKEGVIALDLDRRCTVCNDAARDLFRCKSPSVVGMHLQDISDFFKTSRAEKIIQRVLAQETIILTDVPFRAAPTDAPRYLEIRCFPLYDEGDVSGAISIFFDTTEQRAAQRAIAMHRDQLERQVEERTRDLNAALMREHESLELYKNFGAMISHQFRTPLAIVDSSLQRMARHRESISADEILRRTDKGRASIQRLVQLIESTLDAERLESGRIEVRVRRCELSEMVDNVFAQQVRNAGKHHVRLQHRCTEPCPIVYCDPAHAEHILTNLIANAIKYAFADKPVSVACRVLGSIAEVRVTNYVEGEITLPANTMFKRYYRGDNARGHTGIGIGLYMAKELARLQNGDVRCRQRRVGGMTEITFSLQLPCSAPESDATAHTAGTAVV